MKLSEQTNEYRSKVKKQESLIYSEKNEVQPFPFYLLVLRL